jgi:ABC-2 type transport system permease protein
LLRIFYIFWREYWGNITRRSYLIFTFGFPIFMIATPLIGGIVLAFAIWSALPATDPRPVGIVDQANLFAHAESQPSDPVGIIFYTDTQAATDALANNQIQAYYQIPADYWASGEVLLIYDQAPTEQVDGMVTGWIRAQVRAKAPQELLKRLDRGPNISHHGLTNASTFAQTDMAEPVLVYLVLYFVRLAGAFTASYMFDSIAGEANDRTLEIMITSVSPFQFVTGKLLGLLAVGLTQIGMWGGAILLVAVGGSWLLGVDLLGFLLSWEHLGLMISVLLATYLMDQILAAALGLLRVSGGAGNVLFNTINAVVGISLIYAAYFVPRNPDSVLAVAASLFPLTAPLVMLIRVVVSEVPAWQIAASMILLWGTNLLGLFWLRRLLKANLVAGSTGFELRHWLKARFVDLKAAVQLKVSGMSF